MRILPMTFLSLFTLSLVGQDKPLVSSQKDRQTIRLTIYQGGKALVQEKRSIDLPKGRVLLRVEDLTSGIDPSTFSLQSQDFRTSLGIKRQAFLYARPTAQQLLSRYEGKEVRVPDTKGGSEVLETATLLSGEGGSIALRFPDRVEILNSAASRRLVLPSLPAEVSSTPIMEVTMDNPLAGRKDLIASYLTQDFRWTPSYSVIVQPSETQIDLVAWATVLNSSKVVVENAQIDLLAGDVPSDGESLASLPMARLARGVVSNVVQFAAPPPPPPPSAFGDSVPIGTSVGEHKVYALPSVLTLLPSQSIQVPFLEAHEIKIRKEYRLQNIFGFDDSDSGDAEGTQLPIEKSIIFRNAESEHLGRELPAGTVRIYQPDANGVLRYLGDVQAPESVSGMDVRLGLGTVSDLTAKSRMTDHKVMDDPAPRRILEEKAFEVLLTNRKDKPEIVHVQVEIDGEWTLLSSSHPGTKERAHTLGFQVQVPAKGQSKLLYRVKSRSGR